MTLKQLSEQLATPESTVRLYRDEFAEFLPAVGEGRRRRYDVDTVETLKVIIERKKSGIAAVNIRQELARTLAPREKRAAVTRDERIEGIQRALESQGGEIASLRAEVGGLRDELGRLVALLRVERRGGRTMESVQRERIGE